MKKSKIISWQGQDLCCKELTLEELKQAFTEKCFKKNFLLDQAFHACLPVRAVLLSTGLSVSDLEPLPFSALDALWKAVEDVNPFFVECRATGPQIAARKQSNQKSLDENIDDLCADLIRCGYQAPWLWGYSFLMRILHGGS